MENVFIYSLIDPRNDEPKYIGRSYRPLHRFHYGHLEDSNKSLKSSWIKHLKLNGLIPIMEIIDTVSEDECKFWESHYIWLYKSWGFNLKNGTYGDDSPIRHTQETKNKISKSRKGKGLGYKHSEETKSKMKEKANNRNPECYIKTAQTRKNNNIPYPKSAIENRNPEQYKKGWITRNNNGYKMSDEQKKKLSESHRGQNLGGKLSEEHKKKISDSVKLQWIRQKNKNGGT